jgi:hypothetical protein
MPPKHKLLSFSQEHLHEEKERKKKKKSECSQGKEMILFQSVDQEKPREKGIGARGRCHKKKTEQKKRIKRGGKGKRGQKGGRRRRRQTKRWLMAMGVVVEPKPKTIVVVVGHSREAEIGGDRKG